MSGSRKVIDSAHYVAGLPRELLAQRALGTTEQLATHVAERLSCALTVVRDMKGIKRTIDVKRYLASMEAGVGQEQLQQAGLLGDLLPLTFRLHVSNEGGVRPSEVLEALFEGSELPARLVRTFMGKTGSPPEGSFLSPLALEELRAQVLRDGNGSEQLSDSARGEAGELAGLSEAAQAPLFVEEQLSSDG